MAYTYDLTTSRGKVRLLVPDNDSTTHLLEDAEIDYFLTETGNNVAAAAARCCRQLARQFSMKVTFTADGLTMQHTQRAAEFAKRADELEQEISGGISVASLTRTDGYSDAATETDYEDRIVYIEV